MAKSTWFKFKANKRDLEDTSNVEKDDGSLRSPTKKARGCGSKDSRVKLWIQGEEEPEEGWEQGHQEAQQEADGDFYCYVFGADSKAFRITNYIAN